MTNEFTYDVFLSHSAKDKAVVRPLAKRLRLDGLKAWFEGWVLKPGDSIPAKIDPLLLQSYGATGAGLERSRGLACPAEAGRRRRVLGMSANAFGSDWAQLEAGTIWFRDPKPGRDRIARSRRLLWNRL